MAKDYMNDPIKFMIYSGEDFDVTKHFNGDYFVNNFGVLSSKFEKSCSITNISKEPMFRKILMSSGDRVTNNTPVGVYQDWEGCYWIVVVEHASKVTMQFVGECVEDVVRLIQGSEFFRVNKKQAVS